MLFLFAGCEWNDDRHRTPVPTATALPTSTPEPVAENPSGLPLEIEVEELRSVVRTLAEENRRLREELNQALLAKVPAKVPANVPANVPMVESEQPTPLPPPISPPPPVAVEAPATPDADPAIVLYVNTAWHYLVINKGSDHGLSAQDQIEILRNGAPVAVATISSIKPNQSVADLDMKSLETTGFYPQEKDTVRKK